MFQFLTNLDCEAKVLFSRLEVAKNKVVSEISYADHLAACAAKDTKEKIKEKKEEIKTKREEKKSKKEEKKAAGKTEENKTNESSKPETAETSENKTEDINIVIDVNYTPTTEKDSEEVIDTEATIVEEPKKEEESKKEDDGVAKPEPTIIRPDIDYSEPVVTIKKDPVQEENITLKFPDEFYTAGVIYDIDDDREDEDQQKSQKIKERKAQVTPEDVDKAFEKKANQNKKK